MSRVLAEQNVFESLHVMNEAAHAAVQLGGKRGLTRTSGLTGCAADRPNARHLDLRRVGSLRRDPVDPETPEIPG